jgi:EAL domain-containing protein (putative c-di-GMP-specific phosphodiesterase class I)
MIARLGIAGFDLSLDDFGTGASNFELLRKGAFSEVKLDKSIVQAALGNDDISRWFLTIIAEIAKSMDIRLVAEGIEQGSDIAFLLSYGV